MYSNMFIIIFLIVIFIFIIITLFILFSLFKKDNKRLNLDIINKYKKMAMDIINGIPDIEKTRKEYIKTSIIQSIIIFSTLGFFIGSFINRLFLIGFIISFVLLLISFFFFRKDPTKILYSNIFPSILKKYKDDIKYDHYLGLDKEIYDDAKFDFYDRYNSEDLITGKLRGCNYNIAEVHTQEKEEDKDGNTNWKTIFLGTFANVKLTKSFNSEIDIICNRLKNNNDKYISIDNEEFEKIFDVFTTDKILAMRLLTPDVTTKLIDVYNDTGIYF